MPKLLYNTCPDCRGRKVIPWLGGIDKECFFCQGIGYVKDNKVTLDGEKNATEKGKEQESNLGEYQRARRGRPSSKSSNSNSVIDC